MTTRARAVLEDCRLALSILEEEQDLRRWRITWVSAVALIRAVGHVLQKVDGKDETIKKSANQLYKKWKKNAQENSIFHEFIEKERNNILKEYEVNIHPMTEVPVAVEVTLKSQVTGELRREGMVARIGENIYRPMLDGYREGDDARDVYADAIQWRDEQLSDIEKRRDRVRK